MKPVAYITTSWDDGHPFDFRVAGLLAKYGLQGTFYVPRTGEHDTITTAQLRELGAAFEIGAHTLHHVDLTTATDQQAREEIADSKSWLEDITGKSCPMFCPPKGKYRDRHLQLARQAGYRAVRTAEPMSLDFPRARSGLMVLPTTVHAHPHSPFSYAKYLVGRGTWRNLFLFIVQGRSLDWPKLVKSMLARALEHGGVFHLWGHSWELQQAGQWQRLEEVFRYLSQFNDQAPALTNWQICAAVSEMQQDQSAQAAADTHALAGM